MPKKEVLDVQGRAILKVLLNKKYPVKFCSYGKYLKLKLNTKDPKKARLTAEKMAKNLLCNSLVESYDIEVLSE